ncbi:MAG: hypothetical protein ABSG99_09505 [Sedimentisphaerales bacterium]
MIETIYTLKLLITRIFILVRSSSQTAAHLPTRWGSLYPYNGWLLKYKYSPIWQKVKLRLKTPLSTLLKPFLASLDTWPNKTINAQVAFAAAAG